MISIDKQFRHQVEQFLEMAEMTPTRLGVEALGDPKFVFELRDGRSPSGKTMDKVLAYIDANAPARVRVGT